MDEGRTKAKDLVVAWLMAKGGQDWNHLSSLKDLEDRIAAALAPPGQDAGRRVVELAKVWGACVDDKSTGSMTRLIVAENNLLAAVRAWARGSEQESGDE